METKYLQKEYIAVAIKYIKKGEYRKVCVNFKLLMILNINIENLFMFLTKFNILDYFEFVKI
jgi:hypothetical protein